MIRRKSGLGAFVALMALAVSTSQAAVTYTTHEGALNSAGQPVNAQVEFTIHPDAIVVQVTNLTKDLKSFDQALTAISFSVYNRKAKGDMGFTKGRVRTFTEQGMVTGSQLQETKWTLAKSGNTYTLRAPGDQRGIIPDTQGLTYDKADASITNPGGKEFLVGTVTFQIQIPDISLTDDLIELKFHWGHDVGLAGDDLKVAGRTDAAPDPSKLIGGDPWTPGEANASPSPTGYNEVSYSGERGYLTPVGEAGYVPHGVPGGAPGGGAQSSSNSNTPSAAPLPEWPTDVPLTPPEVPDPNDPVTPPNNVVPGVTPLTPPENPKPNDPIIVPPTPVPEPTTLGLLGLGAAGLLTRRRR